MGTKQDIQKHWKKLLVVVFLAGFLIGAPLALIPTDTLWGIDSQTYGIRYGTDIIRDTVADPDGLGISYDVPALPNYPVVTGVEPQVRMDYGGITHTDSEGMPTPYDLPDREWESSGRKYTIHYYQVETVIRTEAKQVNGYTSLITTFAFVEIARVTVSPMLRIVLQGDEGEDLDSEFGGCYVVSAESVIYNTELEGYVFAGQFDTPYHVAKPTINSRVYTMTETDEPNRQVYVMYKEATLQAGAAYLYNQFNIVYGNPRICDVGVHMVWRFSFTMSRPLTSEDVSPLEPEPDDDPAMPPPPYLDKLILLVMGVVVFVVIIYLVIYYVKRKAQQSTSVSVVKVG